jgi:diacylglycerol O-acyltransferase
MLTIALGLLPATVGVFEMMQKGVDIIATDIPGPPTEAHFASARIEARYAFAPTSGAALNATPVSLAGGPSIGLTIDTGAVADPVVLIECLGRGLDDVASAAATA